MIDSAENISRVVREELDPFEYSAAHLYEQGTTSSTFFDFSSSQKVVESIAYLKNRVNDIITANPWLTGKLVKGKSLHLKGKEAVFLEYSTQPTDAAREKLFQVCKSPQLKALSSDMCACDIVDQIATEKAVFIPTGWKQLRFPELALAKFTVVQCSNREGKDHSLLLIVSISHQLVDGGAYYQLIQMLSRTSPLLAMVTRRDPNLGEKATEAAGPQFRKIIHHPGIFAQLAWNTMKDTLLGCRVKTGCWVVDEEKVTTIKEVVKLDKNGESIPGRSSFVSTNDILVSAYAKAIDVDILAMAMNFRGRLPGIEHIFAGNWMRAVIYHKSSLISPRYIRESLSKGTPIQGVNKEPKLSFLGLLQSKFAIITNWAFPHFQCELVVHPVQETPVALHLPVYDRSIAVFDVAVIFRPSKGRLAVMTWMRNTVSEKQMHEVGFPIGNAM